MSTKKVVVSLACALMTVGALNWGLVGAFQFNLVNALLGSIPALERSVYVLVGLAGLVGVAMLFGWVDCGEKKK